MQNHKKLITSVLVLAVFAVGLILFIRDGRKVNLSQVIRPNENQIQYDLNLSEDMKSLDILSQGKVLKHLTINDLPLPYNVQGKETYEGYSFQFQHDDEKATLDKARNRIYFFVYDVENSGAQNLDHSILAYDFTKDETFLITHIGPSSTGYPIMLSPDYNYMVFSDGFHVSACEATGGIYIFDLVNNKEKAAIYPGKGQVGGAFFTKWLSNDSFAYTTSFFSEEECKDESWLEGFENAPVEKKIYYIK